MADDLVVEHARLRMEAELAWHQLVLDRIGQLAADCEHRNPGRDGGPAVTVRPLRLFGDPVLRTPCDEVLRFGTALGGLVQDLIDTVQVPGRPGLAANQIGSSLAVFSHGCLSIPGVSAGSPAPNAAPSCASSASVPPVLSR